MKISSLVDCFFVQALFLTFPLFVPRWKREGIPRIRLETDPFALSMLRSVKSFVDAGKKLLLS